MGMYEIKAKTTDEDWPAGTQHLPVTLCPPLKWLTPINTHL